MTLTFDQQIWLQAARKFAPPKPRPRRWASPLDMACNLDPTIVRTPALELVNRKLVELADGKVDRLLVAVSPQEGKALALDTPIATTSGWALLGDLRPGDRVFDRNGEPCSVVAVSPIWTDRPCYELLSGDGESIVADAVHEWPARIWVSGPERRVETTELADVRSKNAQIAGPGDLNLPDADLPLDPYVLGAWLGDGHSRQPRITCADAEILERIEDAGWVLRRVPRTDYMWSFVPENWNRGNGNASPFRRALASLDVLGNKHIPVAYLRGSGKQRLALLQGLIDTDGYVSPKGQVEFVSTNRSLAEDVRHLVFSLGAKATLIESRAVLNGRDCGPKYRVRFYLADAAWLPRKAERCRGAKTARTRYVWSRPVESVPVRCIQVDSPDHTFLAGRSLLPTYNSTLCSKWYPAWVLTWDDSRRVAVVSYSDEMARRWGSDIKQIVESNDGTDDTIDLGIRLRGDSRAAGRWQVEGNVGGVYCVGIAGSLTGKPVDLLVLDDPIKDLSAAQSDAYRRRCRDFWQGVAVPRLGPGARCLLVQTRWHEDDMAGWLLASEGEGDRAKGGRWEVVSIPAQAEDGGNDPLGRAPGEYMKSARGDRDWAAIRRSVGEYVWASLYQQRPAPAEGGLFKRLWWRYWTPGPQIGDGERVDLAGRLYSLRDSWRFITGDLAASTRTSADWTVAAVWALTISGDLVLLDLNRAKVAESGHFDLFRPLAQRWAVDTVFLEKSQHGTTLVAEAARSGLHITPLTADTDKLSRAIPASARASGGRIWLPAAAPWRQAFLDETAGFPNAAHDDMVDVLAYACRVAITKWQPPPPRPAPLPHLDEFAFLGNAGVDLSTVPL